MPRRSRKSLIRCASGISGWSNRLKEAECAHCDRERQTVQSISRRSPWMPSRLCRVKVQALNFDRVTEAQPRYASYVYVDFFSLSFFFFWKLQRMMMKFIRGIFFNVAVITFSQNYWIFYEKFLRGRRLESSYSRDELRVEIARKRKDFPGQEDSTYKNL